MDPVASEVEHGLQHWRPKRIGVIGAGAMGSSLAAIVGQTRPVALVCRRPERAAEIFRHGVRTCGAIHAHARPIVVRCIADLAEIGGVSLVFVATKTTAIPEVAAELKAVMERLGDQPGAPFVVSYQNGIEPGRQLMSMIGDDRIFRMVLSIGAVMRPGKATVEMKMSAPPHSIGSPTPAYRIVGDRVAAMLTAAGLETHYEPDIERAVWAKGIVNAAMNPVAALVNATVGEVLASPSHLIVDTLLREGIAVAEADGIKLGDDFLDRAYWLIDQSRDHVPSMVEDIRAGRESEVGQLNRQIIEFGERCGVATTTHKIIDALIETFDWKIYHHNHPSGHSGPGPAAAGE